MSRNNNYRARDKVQEQAAIYSGLLFYEAQGALSKTESSVAFSAEDRIETTTRVIEIAPGITRTYNLERRISESEKGNA